MAALASPALDLLERLYSPSTLARLGILHGTADLAADRGNVLSLDWPELERVLPDRGFPRSVIEIASPISRQGAMRGGATTIALAAVRAVHAMGAATSAVGEKKDAWCAWITESNAPPLYAPAAAAAGVDLERLLVVRPPPADLARTVVKVAASGAFDLVVVDAHAGLDGKLRTRIDGSVVVRKLALAAEEKGTTFILLTNIFTSRAVPWPVALRLEVERRPEAISVRITKDRRGRASSQHVVRVAC
jgi:recombination protein RecA